jgi:hypothetical protein
MPIADLDLLARVVAHERWPAEWAQPWHPRVLLEQPCPVQREEPGILWRWHPEPGRWLPDPDDHATGGVLLGLVRVGLPDGGYLVVSCDPDVTPPWSVEVCPQHVGDNAHDAPTLGWACVRALAALWGVA